MKTNEISDSGMYGVWFDGCRKRNVLENIFSNNLEGDLHFTNTFGEIYLNKSVGQISVFWTGLTYFVSIFVLYRYRDNIKDFLRENE